MSGAVNFWFRRDDMLRRRFLEILATASALAGNGLNGLHDGIARAGRMLRAQPLPQPAQAKSPDFALTELLARRTVPLGMHRSRPFYVSLDDITTHRYPASIGRGRNALVISVYEEEGAPVQPIHPMRSSALVRAVLAELRTTSPSDYREVSGQLGPGAKLEPGRVLPLHLNVPPEKRHQFPMDDLLAVIFEKGSSGNLEDFGWVERIFKIAEQRHASNLIVPCLGRNLRDRHSIEFGDFFSAVLRRVPSGKQPANVYFSLYAQWPTFELQDAVAGLNRAWKGSLS
jgi:hypothetical protein